MDVELLTVGTELLLGFTLDTNAAELGQQLSHYGLRVTRQATVPDTVEAIRDALATAVQRAPLIIVTGGLGPTDDDCTREAVAGLLGLPLVFDETIWASLEARAAALGRALPDTNRPQAMVPVGATVLPNRWGTAPGLWIPHPQGTVVLLPGVPSEMRALLTHEVLPRLPAATRLIGSRLIRTVGVSEARLGELLSPLRPALAPLTLAYLPDRSMIDLRLTCWDGTPAEVAAELARGERLVREVVGEWCYGTESDDLAAVVLQRLRARGLRLAVAESCTGGMLGARLTAVPGCSDVFQGGVMVYGNAAKQTLLGVPEALLDAHGAVSEPVAEAMARGVAARLNAGVGVGITGIAGPGGGSPEKPVGTVYLSILVGERITVEKLALLGDREQIRERAIVAALARLRQAVTDS